ncbi:MAG: FHA domain-containing protein [Gammaproteobacteria bacterium]|nr:FHA domain-containing protein [Gammaproteobacteria bacterium]
MAKLTLAFRGHVTSVHHLNHETIQIGRAQDCDIHIDSLAVAPYHAQLEYIDDNYIVTPCSDDNRIQVNNETTESTPLKHGDILQVGKHSLSFSRDEITLAYNRDVNHDTTESDPEMDNQLEKAAITLDSLPSGGLQITDGDHVGKIIPLHRSLLRLGLTGNECAAIARRESGYYISRLEGSPPKVNDQPLEEQAILLKDGDRIKVGKMTLRFFEEIVQHAAS